MTRASHLLTGPPGPSLHSNWFIAVLSISNRSLPERRPWHGSPKICHPSRRIDQACSASRVRSARDGQGELERGARADIARGPYPSLVSFDNRTTDRKPH